MTRLTIIRCSEEDIGLQDAQKVLQKLSEASQIKDVLWSSPNSHSQLGNSSTRAWRIQDGFLDEVDLDLEIAHAGALTNINIFTTCSFLLETEKQASLTSSTNEFITDLRGRIPQTTTVNDYRLFFPRFGALRPGDGFFQSVGCSNLIVIPEDREFPQTIAYPLSNATSNDRFSWHVAGEIISLIGTWGTMHDDVLFVAPPAVGGPVSARLIRSFARSAISTYHSPDELLNAGENLHIPQPPAPDGYEQAPDPTFTQPSNPVFAIEKCAREAYAPAFIIPEYPPFDPKLNISGKQVISLAIRRVISDLIHLPQTVRNGIQSELDAARDGIAQGLIGEHSWLQVNDGSLLGNPQQGSKIDMAEAVIGEILASGSPPAHGLDSEDRDRLLEVTLGSIDGSESNPNFNEGTVIVDRSVLIPRPSDNQLESSVESLGGFPQDLPIGSDNGQEVDGQEVDGQEVDGQEVDGQEVEDEAVDGQEVEDEAVDGQEVEDEAVDGQEVEDEAVDGQEQPVVAAAPTLLGLISSHFSGERNRMHETVLSSIDQMRTLSSPSERDLSGNSRIIKYFFFSSMVLLVLAVGTLIRPVREILAFDGFSAALRLKIFTFLSAIIAIPVGLLFRPREKQKGRIYLIILLSSIAGGLTLILLKASSIGESVYGSELLSGALRWLLTIVIVAFLVFATIVGLRRTKSATNGTAYWARRALLVLIPTYGISMYLIGFNQLDPQWGFSEWVIGQDSLLFKVTIVVALVAFFTSGAIVSVGKFQDEKRLNAWGAEMHYLSEKTKISLHYRDLLSQFQIEWLGTASVLQRLIINPFGDAETMDTRTASVPLGSEDILKYKTITLNLTEKGEAAFVDRAVPTLTPAGWLTSSYRLVRDSFINNPKANSGGTTLPEHCDYTWAAGESALDAGFADGRGTRWPFAHAFYNGDLDGILRSTADEELEKIILNIFLKVPNSWESDTTQEETPALSDIFFEIVPSEGVDAKFSMGMFGDHAAMFNGSTNMTSSFAWPSNVELPADAPKPTSIAEQRNINSSVIFQAVSVDISDLTNLDELGPTPRSTPPSGPLDTPGEHDTPNFGG